MNLRLDIPPELLDDIVTEVTKRVLAEIATAPAALSPYVTIAEAAELLRCRRHRINDLLSQGKFPRTKDGTRTLIRRTDIENYLAGRSTTP